MMNNDYGEIFNEMDAYMKRVSAPLRQAEELVKPVMQAIESTFKSIDLDKMVETMERVRKGLIKTEEDLKLFKVAIIDLGFPPHEDMDIPTIRGIAEAYREDRDNLKLMIDDIMCDYYDSDFISAIGLLWEDNSSLASRMPILRNVIMAHNLGLYNVSVPTIVAQFEGLLVESYTIKGNVNGNIIKILLNDLLKSEDVSFSFNDEIKNYYENRVLTKFKHGEKLASDVSRHAILHGADVDYGKETVSIKTILLFDFIATKLKDLSTEDIRTTKEKVRKYRRSRKR